MNIGSGNFWKQSARPGGGLKLSPPQWRPGGAGVLYGDIVPNFGKGTSAPRGGTRSAANEAHFKLLLCKAPNCGPGHILGETCLDARGRGWGRTTRR